MSLQLRDYQARDVERIREAFARGKRRVLYVSPTGCHAPGTKILMFDGTTKLVESIVVGDRLMGPDSRPRTVLHLHHGHDEMFKVTPRRGSDPFVVNGGHILSLIRTNDGEKRNRTGEVWNVSVREYIGSVEWRRHLHKLRRCAVEFDPSLVKISYAPYRRQKTLDYRKAYEMLAAGSTRAQVAKTLGATWYCVDGLKRQMDSGAIADIHWPPIEPYFLGVLLGDGSMKTTLNVTTMDGEIVEECSRQAEAWGCEIRVDQQPDNNAAVYHFVGVGSVRGRYSPLKNALRSLGLWGLHGGDKFIPHAYKVADTASRLEILAGLMDTDGHLAKSCEFDYVSKSELLADDVCFVARSVGIRANKAAKIINGTTYWRVHLSGDVSRIPTRLPRKQGTPPRCRKNPLITGFSVEPVGVGEFYGFTLDRDHLYLTDDFVVHHNSGKTVLFAHITAGVARKQKKVTILTHRDFLHAQVSGALKKFDVSHGSLKGGSRGISRQPVMVSSVFTLAKRLQHYPAPDLIIGDECHHFTLGSTWGKAVNAFPNARVLGVTASPCRLDGQGMADMFDEMIVGPSVAELTAMGWLVPCDVYAPSKTIDLRGLRTRGGDYAQDELEATMDKPAITGDAVNHYLTYAAGTQAVGFCCSIRHAEHTAEQFRAAGISAACVHGKMDTFDLHKVFTGFERGELKCIFACDLISEGYDVPRIETVISLRPTQSLSLYLQQVGRGLRPYPGKNRLIHLDAASNTVVHGWVDEPRDWQLTGTLERKQQGIAVPRVVTCPHCFAMHRPLPACPRCGHVYEATGRVVENVEGELIQVSRSDEMDQALRDATEVKELERLFWTLVNVAKGRRYMNPEKWAFDIVCGHAAKKRAQSRDPSAVDTINGLTPDELEDLRRATIMKAMSKEDRIDG